MKSLLLLFTCLFIAACAKEKSEEVSLEFEDKSWFSNCLSMGNSGYQKSEMLFKSDGGFFIRQSAYLDASCNSLLFIQEISGTFITSANTGERKNIDLTLASMTLTSKSSAATNGWNNTSLCGISNWTLNTTRSIVGLTCGSDTMPVVGDKSYDIYYIDTTGDSSSGTKKGDLLLGYTGGSNDGSTEAKRPTDLSTSVVYFR